MSKAHQDSKSKANLFNCRRSGSLVNRNSTFNVAKISGNKRSPYMAINDEQNINLRIVDSVGGNLDLGCVEVPGSPISE